MPRDVCAGGWPDAKQGSTFAGRSLIDRVVIGAQVDICTPLGYTTNMRRPVSVIEFAGYRQRANDLLTVDEQEAVVDLIAYEPTCGDLIVGTGGLRKVRVGRGGRGKRGGARVIYYFHDADFPVLLLALYAKNEKADLSARETKHLADAMKEMTSSWRKK